MNRLVIADNIVQIDNTRNALGDNITISDARGDHGTFTAIAVIHHSGEVVGNTTLGHYQTDVLDKKSNHWIRTSDDALPILISRNEITDRGYIFLFKKLQS